MFFAKKSDKKPPDEPQSANPKASADGDSALDAAAGLLRILGKYAFDLDQYSAQTVNGLCEQWARHILVGSPHPGAADNADASALAERNWQGLREFVTQLRQQEKTFVATHFKEIRNVLGDFIDTLGKVIAENQEDQTQIADQLNRLKSAIESNAPPERLKQEAMRVIGVIGAIAEQRQQAQRDTLKQLSGKLRAMREELSAARREMELDPLTRLYNRKAFDQQLQRTFEFNKLSGQPACLLMADLDHFKRINDQFGHLAGDLVLKKFADCCAQTFPRRSDFVARYGGEEFAIIVQEVSTDVAAMLAKRLLQAVRALRIHYENHEVSVTVSVGVAELNPQDELSSWLRHADEALYRAKQDGRDRFAL
ncbi:MAG TPA: GGDEF domain-containing protein [Candidatus Competibacter sp.]|nr:GGDEF domain-containing protein [Candidatus Competibacteraceae bacterium]HRC72855.1 GGDEF domain-containing protein [Candidatus Competibacter sp.]